MRSFKKLVIFIFTFVVLFENQIYAVDNRYKPTPEQKEFVEKIFYPLLNDATNNYPLNKIGQKMQSLRDQNIRGKIKITLNYYEDKNIVGPAAIAIDKNGNVEIALFVPRLIKNYQQIKNKETYKDLIIIFLLHEHYHFTKHLKIILPNPKNPQKPKPLILKEVESDAWWYTCREIIMPMLKKNRLKNMPPNHMVMIASRAYSLANGNRNSHIWQKFSMYAADIAPQSILPSYIISPRPNR